MSYALKCSKIIIYTDDTSLAYSAKNVSNIFNVSDIFHFLNYESLRKGLYSNNLSLNVAKTVSTLICTKIYYNIKAIGNCLGQSVK